MKKLILLLALVLLLTGCSQIGPQNQTTAPTQTEAQLTAAPNFTMFDSQGNPHTLSDFRGKPTILNFWASWCSPCKAEMPDLEQAYQLCGQKINFVMVNLTDGSRETVESAAAFIDAQGYTFPVFYDINLAGASAYKVSSIPITFFIDADGNLVTYYKGAMSKSTLQACINMLLPTE